MKIISCLLAVLVLTGLCAEDVRQLESRLKKSVPGAPEFRAYADMFGAVRSVRTLPGSKTGGIFKLSLLRGQARIGMLDLTGLAEADLSGLGDHKELKTLVVGAGVVKGLQSSSHPGLLRLDISRTKITEPWRAEGLHKILYRCPHCQTEFKLTTKGTELTCEACGKVWHMNEDSTLTATVGETEFTHIPDWFEWERECVREEILNCTYSFKDTVDVHSMPRCYRFMPLGEGKLTHDPENGFVLTGHYRGEDYRIQRTPLQTNSLHVEYDFPHIKPFDCVDISTESDSFYCYPTKENVVTKLAFATEEIYKLKAVKGSRVVRSKEPTKKETE